MPVMSGFEDTGPLDLSAWGCGWEYGDGWYGTCPGVEGAVLTFGAGLCSWGWWPICPGIGAVPAGLCAGDGPDACTGDGDCAAAACRCLRMRVRSSM